MPKVKGLSPKMAIFVEEYLVDLDAAKAALRAGYSAKSAKSIGAENLTKPAVAAAVEKGLAKKVKKIEITQDAVIQELAAIGFSNIADVAEWDGNTVKVLPSETRSKRVLSAVAGVTATQHGLTLRMHDKTTALLNLGKHLGMFREKAIIEVRDGNQIVERMLGKIDEYAAKAVPGELVETE